MTFTVTGNLSFTTFANPWIITTDSGEQVDIRPIIFQAVAQAKGERTSMDYGRGRYKIYLDQESKYVLDASDHNFIISIPDAFGFSNSGLYLETFMQFSIGQVVTVTVTIDSFEMVAADNGEHTVYFSNYNMCKIGTNDEVKSICQPGTENTCAYLVMSPTGFECAKFSTSTARTINHRLDEGTMRATRQGNCRNGGRREVDNATH